MQLSFPQLSTERLVLRQLNVDDAPGIFLLRSDEEVNKWLDRPKAITIDDALAFIQKIDTVIENKQGLFWAICSREDPRLVGTACIYNINKKEQKAEIGYELIPAYNGKGFMQEAIFKVIEYGFGSLHLKTIEAVVHIDNRNSIKLLEKIKFSRDHEAEAKMHPDERSMGMIAYSLKDGD